MADNEAYDLRKFYQLDSTADTTSNTADADGSNLQNEGYEAEHEEDDDAEPPATTHSVPSPPSAPTSTNRKFNERMRRKVAQFKADTTGKDEVDEDDDFWNHWDRQKEKVGDGAITEKETSLLHRKAGEMFEYEADSTSSSDSEYEYDKLTAQEVGDDARAVLDDDGDGEGKGVATKRLAVVNCDWDNLSAADLYMIFRSFLPPEGSVVSVSVHPSDYGVKMMAKEDQFGPDTEIWTKNELPAEVKEMEAAATFIDDNEDHEEWDEDGLPLMPPPEGVGVDSESEEEVEEPVVDEMDENSRRLQEEMEKLERLEETITKIRQGRVGDVLEDEADTIYNKQALRKYELQKLRYFYAVKPPPHTLSTCTLGVTIALVGCASMWTDCRVRFGGDCGPNVPGPEPPRVPEHVQCAESVVCGGGLCGSARTQGSLH